MENIIALIYALLIGVAVVGFATVLFQEDKYRQRTLVYFVALLIAMLNASALVLILITNKL